MTTCSPDRFFFFTEQVIAPLRKRAYVIRRFGTIENRNMKLVIFYFLLSIFLTDFHSLISSLLSTFHQLISILDYLLHILY